jgi:hypothetical protein
VQAFFQQTANVTVIKKYIFVKVLKKAGSRPVITITLAEMPDQAAWIGNQKGFDWRNEMPV